MYNQRNYGNYNNRYGGNYQNYSMQNRMAPRGQNHMHEKHSHEECKEYPLAMGYVPWQTWGDLYEPCDALNQGTIFKDLNYKFCG